MALWLSIVAAWLVATYAIYPLWLRSTRRQSLLAGNSVADDLEAAVDLPCLAFVITARNEQALLREKLMNTLALDYPRERLDIVVVSDGSTDGTAAIAREFEGRGVRLLELTAPRGKTLASEIGARSSTGSIVVFSDATGMLVPGALRSLASSFADPAVGVATGRVLYRASASVVAQGLDVYQRWVVTQRRREAIGGSATVVSGSLHAVRRELLGTIDEHHTYDLAWPLLAAQAGYRCAYAADAVTVEAPRDRAESELRARLRMGIRCWRFAALAARSLARSWHSRYAAHLFFHKVMRWVSAPLIVATTVWAIASPAASLWHLVAATGASVLWGGAAVGAVGASWFSTHPGRASRLFGGLLFFATVVFAYTVALALALTGQRIAEWNPERRVKAAPHPTRSQG